MNKNNIHKIISITLLIALMFSGNVSASALNVEYSKDLISGKMTVETVSVENDIVTVQVLPADLTPEQIAQNPALGTNTKYVRNEVVGEDGKFTFTFPLQPGDYVLNVASKLSDGNYYSQSFNFADGDAYRTLISQLKTVKPINGQPQLTKLLKPKKRKYLFAKIRLYNYI